MYFGTMFWGPTENPRTTGTIVVADFALTDTPLIDAVHYVKDEYTGYWSYHPTTQHSTKGALTVIWKFLYENPNSTRIGATCPSSEHLALMAA